MSVDAQTQLAIISEESQKHHYCSKLCDESSPIPNGVINSEATEPKQLRCKNGIKPNIYQCGNQRSRLPSRDSGISQGSPLDPIAEDAHHFQYKSGDCFHEDSRKNLPALLEENTSPSRQTGCRCCGMNQELHKEDITQNNHPSFGCKCGSFPQRMPSDQCIQERCPHMQEDVKSGGQVVNQRDHRYERIRNNSARDSFYSDDTSRRSDQIIMYNNNEPSSGLLLLRDRRENEYGNDIKNEKYKDRRSRMCRGLRIFVVIFLFLTTAAFVTIVVHNVYDMKKMEEKIEQLEKEINNNRDGGSMAMMQATRQLTATPPESSRPFIHLTLKVEKNIPLTSWGYRVLQWMATTSRDGEESREKALEYDTNKKRLIIHKSGTYFVYNQIYVYRHVSEYTPALAKMDNQTLFHVIFNRPFNYPSNKKPLLITESTLSNCWNKNADTQVHTSYQGIIVNLQANDELLVGLQNYNSAVDTLVPKSTFFGIFKL